MDFPINLRVPRLADDWDAGLYDTLPDVPGDDFCADCGFLIDDCDCGETDA